MSARGTDVGEKPLHVQVHEALGCGAEWRPGRDSCDACGREGHAGWWERLWDETGQPDYGFEDGNDVPRYDTDWKAAGPLIKRFNIALRPPTEPERSGEYWEAYAWVYPPDWNGKTYGDVREVVKGDKDPLVAVSHLIVELAAIGKLHTESPRG